MSDTDTSHFHLKEYFKDDEKTEVIKYINDNLVSQSKSGLVRGTLEDYAPQDYYDIPLKIISHAIKEVNIIGNSVVVVKYKILNTECGKIAQSIEESGIKIHMNYIKTKDFCVSGFIDLSNDNASTCFCFISELVPNTDNIFFLKDLVLSLKYILIYLCHLR